MKKFIKKADEMEMAINLKASRYAFGFLEIAIMIYCIMERVITGEFPPLFLSLGYLECLSSGESNYTRPSECPMW